ncbi:MAG: EamA family transporter [Alphaproteobacteria bacterium]
MKPLDILLAVSVPTVWGFGFIFAKAAMGEFPPILLMALRFTLTALVLVWFVRVPRGLMGRIFVVSLVSATIQYSLTFTGLRDLDASIAIIVVQLEVPFGALLAAIFLKDRIGWRRAFGMALAFVGVGLIAGEPRVQQNIMPMFLVVGGAFTWAAGQVMIKTLGRVGGFTLIAWVAVMSAPQLFVASFLFEDGQFDAIAGAGWIGWGTVVYLGLVMTALGYAAWYHLLGKYQVNQMMPYLLLLPVVTVIGSVALLGERLTLPVALGGGVVIVGVAIIVTYKRQSRARVADQPGE